MSVFSYCCYTLNCIVCDIWRKLQVYLNCKGIYDKSYILCTFLQESVQTPCRRHLHQRCELLPAGPGSQGVCDLAEERPRQERVTWTRVPQQLPEWCSDAHRLCAVLCFTICTSLFFLVMLLNPPLSAPQWSKDMLSKCRKVAVCWKMCLDHKCVVSF